LGEALILVADVFGYFLAEPIRRLKFCAFRCRAKLDFSKHQTLEISTKYVELDFLARVVDFVTNLLDPSTFGARPKSIELVVTQFDFQFSAL